MLVLSRKETEQILIGSDVVVTVSRIFGNRVQLAIHAPRSIHIVRAELEPIEATVTAVVETGPDEIALADGDHDNPIVHANDHAAVGS